MRWQVDGLTEQMDTEYGPLCMVYKLSQSRPGEQQGVGGGGKVEKSKEAAMSYKALVSTVRREGFIPNEIKNH